VSEAAILHADWLAPRGVQACTTLRHGAGVSRPPFDDFNLGMRAGDDPDAVARNRAELIERFALPSPPRWLRQVHGTAVAVEPGVVARDADAPEADAAVTRTPGTVLAILTADCLPVVFAADDGAEVGAAHAGWRAHGDAGVDRGLI
jgi:copper oxidase (laccase) domain-containing protein